MLLPHVSPVIVQMIKEYIMLVHCNVIVCHCGMIILLIEFVLDVLLSAILVLMPPLVPLAQLLDIGH